METEWAAGRVSHLQERGEAAVKYLLRLQQAHRDYALGAEEEPEPSELDDAVARGHENIYVYNIHIYYVHAFPCISIIKHSIIKQIINSIQLNFVISLVF